MPRVVSRWRSAKDDVGSHLADTLWAGHGLCRREAVRVLVEEGPDRIEGADCVGRGSTRSANGLRHA